MRTLAVLVIWGASCSAALSQQQYQMKALYNESDFQAWAGTGAATLHGQGFLKTVGGDVKTCAGSPVYLMPANAYSQELIAANDAGYQGANIDPRAMAFTRTTLCDAQGNFTFANIPAQSWYVGTKVTWQVPHIVQPGETPGPLTSLILGIKPPPDFDTQGGELRKMVTLRAGDNQVFLIGSDQLHYQASAPPVPPGRVTSDTAPYLGIAVVTLPSNMAAIFKLDGGHGLWILKIVDDSPASRAGLKIGDVILAANGAPWDTVDEMVKTMNALHQTDLLELKIWHSGNTRTIQVRF